MLKLLPALKLPLYLEVSPFTKVSGDKSDDWSGDWADFLDEWPFSQGDEPSDHAPPCGSRWK